MGKAQPNRGSEEGETEGTETPLLGGESGRGRGGILLQVIKSRCGFNHQRQEGRRPSPREQCEQRQGGGGLRSVRDTEPGGASGKEPACQCSETQFDVWVRKITWRRAQQSSAVFLPGISHGQRTLEATVHRVSKSQTRLKGLSAGAQNSPVRLKHKHG